MDTLQKYKREVDKFLATFLSSKQKDFARVNSWGPDAIEKIRSIVSEGKTIRGSLVLLVHDILHGHVKSEALRVAAAYELIQTGLIIHDDIMDHDTLRRGKPTMHIQYKNEGLAMCVGDILFFLAHELLDQTPVQKLSAQVFQEVSIAQMQDVSFGLRKDFPTKDEILSLYTHKTARYTFSLPMMSGAILVRADKKTIRLFEQLGESMGILFQIQDDVIGLIGDPKITGKSRGADVRENKKTLARYYKELGESVNDAIQKDIDVYTVKAHRSLQLLRGKQIDTTVLTKLLSFVITRKR